MNETPETDAACDADKGWGWSGLAPIELCRKLERERDEARREAEAAWREAQAGEDGKWPKCPFSWIQ
jgi:hypothetical protein